MVHRVITDIEIPHYTWQKVAPVTAYRDNNAFDTETIEGKAFLISDAYDRYRSTDNLYDLLSFLTYKPYRQTVNWFYNLEYDTNALLAYLSYDKRLKIAQENTVDYEDYRIEIIPKKRLRIGTISSNDKSKNTTTFYDLAQFYEMQKLVNLAKKTSYAKIEVEDIAQINYDKYKTDLTYQDLINSRCTIDCKITKELADQFTNKISGVVNINRYISKASIARQYVLENIKESLNLPSIALMQAALNAYHAGHIETCKLGFFDKVHNIDINSAYPFTTSQLYDPTGKFKHSKEYEPDTAYSFYHIEIDYEDPYLTPIWVNIKNKNYHPNGKVDIWVTQMELEFFMLKGFDFQILAAYHLLKRLDHEQPFMNLVHDLYDKRIEAKKDGDPIQLTYKIILNSIYGVTINTIELLDKENETDNFEISPEGKLLFYGSKFKATNMYNPLFAAYITAGTRIQLFTDLYKHLDKLIAINTDGVYLSRPAKVPVSNRLGDYSHDIVNKILVMGSGRHFSFFEDGLVDNDDSKFRSIPKQPQEIYNLMENNREGSTLAITREKPIKLKESTRVAKFKDRFNQFRPVTKQVSFKVDRRYWYDSYDTIGDIFDKTIDSRPFNVNELE